MVQKLKFSIDNANIISENPKSNFAVLELDFFASGENLHDMYVSEETLMRTASTIKNCPLVWKYDERLDDIYTHDKEEVPCGFVPETSEIKSKKLADGRTMLSVIAYVWKRYTGELLNIFRRDGGKKPVSVELSLFDSQVLPDGLLELLDFRYEGITVLGSFVTPAIPLASANVLSFAEIKKEYQEALEEFSFSEAEAERLKREEENKMTFDENIVTFPYKNISDINPALKGISPPISIAQANAIAKQADSIGVDEKKNGWAIAISSFKKTHHVEDGKWVKNKGSTVEASEEEETDEPEKEEKAVKKTFEELMAMSAEEREPLLAEMSAEEKQEFEAKMAIDTPKKEEKETPEEEKKESPEEQKKEEEKGVEKKFEFPKNFDMSVMSTMFSDEEEEEEVKMAKEEITKGEFANPSVLMGGMFAKMCKMSNMISKMAEDNKTYMAELENLKKFKTDLEESQKKFAVEETIRVLSEKVIIPDEAKEEMIAEAEKYSFDKIEEWKTYCKAKSFDFAIKEGSKSDVVRVGMPFSETTLKKKDDLWA